MCPVLLTAISLGAMKLWVVAEQPYNDPVVLLTAQITTFISRKSDTYANPLLPGATL